MHHKADMHGCEFANINSEEGTLCVSSSCVCVCVGGFPNPVYPMLEQLFDPGQTLARMKYLFCSGGTDKRDCSVRLGLSISR